jgi:methionine aminopeptidase
MLFARRHPPEVVAEARELAVELGQVFDEVEPSIVAGVTTREIDDGYPDACITSVNEVAANGLPSDRVLEAGDLLKLELGLRGSVSFAIQGWTYPIGPPRGEDRRLIQSAREALRRAVALVAPSARTGDLGWAIQSTIEGAGFNVNRTHVGFAIGTQPHEDPPLPGYGNRRRARRHRRWLDRHRQRRQACSDLQPDGGPDYRRRRSDLAAAPVTHA